MFDSQRVEHLLLQTAQSLKQNGSFSKGQELLAGVDLGTAYIVLVVVNAAGQPVACEMEAAQVLKDGLVVDYIGAVETVKRLKQRVEDRLGVCLAKAAIAVPPGTGTADQRTHRYIVEACDLEVVRIMEEPVAANAVLQIENGVIVDVGGGTTGLSVIRDGEVVFTADEATGGTHISLVLMGRYGLTFEQAEEMKQNPALHPEVLRAVMPVLQKMASIVRANIQGFEVDCAYLVGGTCCLTGIEEVFARELGIRTYKPSNPLLVTPLGIALGCAEQESAEYPTSRQANAAAGLGQRGGYALC